VAPIVIALVIIVGAGIIGTTIAYELRRRAA
jgi:L-2-hydroxyglutarate oxidase LhgO